jgi:hypothetical protein
VVSIPQAAFTSQIELVSIEMSQPEIPDHIRNKFEPIRDWTHDLRVQVNSLTFEVLHFLTIFESFVFPINFSNKLSS